jgi:hypothetical protein
MGVQVYKYGVLPLPMGHRTTTIRYVWDGKAITLAVASSLATFRHGGYLRSDVVCRDSGAHGLRNPSPSFCLHLRVFERVGPESAFLECDTWNSDSIS